MESNKPPKIFLSHSHKDKAFVRKLADKLSSDGFQVWYDKWEIRVGDSIVEKINAGITGSDLLAIVLSKRSVKSKWVKEELNAAMLRNVESEGVFLMPIIIEKCRVPSLLSHRAYADFTDTPELGYQKLLQAIAFHFWKVDVFIGGRWVGETGHLDLIQRGKQIRGEYSYNSETPIGKLEGSLIDRHVLLFNWEWIENPSRNGKGYFYIPFTSNQLLGAWWDAGMDDYIDEEKILKIHNIRGYLTDELKSVNQRVVSNSLKDSRQRKLGITDWSFKRVD